MNNEELINDIIDKLNASVKDIDDQLSALEGADELDDTINNRRFTLEQRKAPLENLIRSMQGVTTNIRALNELDEIVPRDDQDREEMRDERRQREEENDRRLSELPLEYQREIDDFAIAEVAEIEERIEELRNNRQTTLASEYFKRMTTEEHDLARLRERLYNSALRETEALRGLNEQNSTEEEREYQEEIVKKLRESLTDEQRENLDNAMREQNVDQVQQEVSAENANNPEKDPFEGLIEHIISELESSRDSVSQQLAELEGADELDDTVNERRFSLELRRQNFDNLIRSMQGVTTNIRALNELDEIVPRDDQDREEMREERRQREEENDRRLNELPLEYQREIDDFVIAEMARTEERIEELRNNRQTTLASEYAKRMAKEEHTLERLRERLYNSTLREIEEFNRLRQTGRNENERVEQEERVIKLRRNLTDEQRRRTDAATNTNSNVNQDQVGLNSDQTVVPNPTEVTGTGQNAEPNPAEVVETGQNTEPNPTEVTGTGQNAEPNPTEVVEGEQTVVPELNEDVNILDENFNPFSISFDDFTNRVSTERRRLLAENTAESASNLQKINDMYQRVARVRAQERYDPTYAHDENGNVIYYPNTFVPRPREQSPLEDMEQYNAFLTNEYGRRVSEAQYRPENTESQTREQAYTYIREPAPYRLTRDQIIQDLPINSPEESRYQGGMTDEEIEAARQQIFPTTTAQATETNETQVEGTSTPTESDSQEVEPTAPVSEEVGNEEDDITAGIRETSSYPALPPAEERPALPPGRENTDNNQTTGEGTVPPTESDSQEVEPRTPTGEEVGNIDDVIIEGIRERETSQRPALPPARESTDDNQPTGEGTSTPTESDSQEVEPTAPVSEEVGNEEDDITAGIRETNSYPALPPAEERPALPLGEERLALPPGKETEDKDEPKPNPDGPDGPKGPKDPPLLPESKPRRSLDSILADIKCDENGNPFEIDAKIGNTLRASNIKASQVFTDELRNTPWTYAVLGIAPAFVKATFAFISKVTAKAKLFFTGKPNVEEQIRERIRQLPREEQETIFREYRGNIALQRKEASVVNNAITAEMGRIGAEIAERNEAIMSEIYTEVFARYKEAQAYDDAIAQATTDEEKAELTRRKASALEGSADLINQFRMLNIETNQLKAGGIKGQQDDLNAVNSKMNYQGRRHAKIPKYDEEYAELDRHIGELADDEIAAIANGDNERAVKRFVERELEYAQNTENRGSLFGKRSVGRFDFKPLPVDLDYRPDPFVRNLFSTIAIAGAAISTFNGIQTHLREQQQAIDAHNQHIADANAHNQTTMDQVHTTGQDIADHREVFGEGMKAQAQEDIIGRINTNERYGLDSSAAEYGSWAINTDTYRQIDDAGHAVAEQMQQQAQTGLNDIANQVAAGTMTQQQALQGLSDLANSTQQSFNELLEQSLPVLQNYIPGHPQFELDGLSQAMQYMVSHPDAISQMNQGMVDVTALGESLGGLTFDQVQALENLPSDLATTLFGAASAAALVTNVNSNMQPRPKNKETNSELFRMVEEFSEEQDERASTDTKDDSYQKSA